MTRDSATHSYVSDPHISSKSDSTQCDLGAHFFLNTLTTVILQARTRLGVH